MGLGSCPQEWRELGFYTKPEGSGEGRRDRAVPVLPAQLGGTTSGEKRQGGGAGKVPPGLTPAWPNFFSASRGKTSLYQGRIQGDGER